MAIHEFDCKGFGQIEPSQVWFTRSGMVEAQCELDPKRFASHFPLTMDEVNAEKVVAENGAFLCIDKERKIATLPSQGYSKGGFNVGINYSSEKIYNQFAPGRRNFCMIAGEYLPKIGFVEPGMRICTNSVCWDDTCGLFKTKANSSDKSKEMYEQIKAYLAKVRDLTSGRNKELTSNTTGKALAPLYAILMDDKEYKNSKEGSAADAYKSTCLNKGKLVIGGDLSKALFDIYAVVTEAYYNADGTPSFKFVFTRKPDEGLLTGPQDWLKLDDED